MHTKRLSYPVGIVLCDYDDDLLAMWRTPDLGVEEITLKLGIEPKTIVSRLASAYIAGENLPYAMALLNHLRHYQLDALYGAMIRELNRRGECALKK